VSERLRESRRRFERSLDDLRDAFDREFGLTPRMGRWVLPLVAGALGLIGGTALRRGLPGLRAERRARRLSSPSDA
jgi:hypothetical protein